MRLNQLFLFLATILQSLVQKCSEIIAIVFGYPNNPGMPTIRAWEDPSKGFSEWFYNLPRHETSWSASQPPKTWFEVLVGTFPKVDPVPRYIYESQEEGFYNFYIENYQNIYFLPDWLSELLQIKLNLCLDLSLLEAIRESLFVGLAIFCQMLIFRISLSWFIAINPYQFPWYYFTGLVDWADEIFQGLIPSFLGINITGSTILGILGVLADNLNHLVLTMPFLPSEGEPTQLLINHEIKNVIRFHYLPILWYRYPIPNTIRQFWYLERPDILEYMQNAYQDLRINFLPDQIVSEFNSLYQDYMASLLN